MTITEKIYAFIREARTLNRHARISDFQMRVRDGETVELFNLKTHESKLFAAQDEKDTDWQ